MNVFGVADLRFSIQKTLQPLRRRLGRLKPGETLSHFLNWNVEKTGVLHEYKKVSERKIAAHRKQASSPDGQTHTRCAERHHDREIDGRMQRIAKRIIKHFGSERLKFLQVLFLTDERLRSSNSSNSLIETRSNLRVRLASQPLSTNELLLINRSCDRQRRDDAENDQCQFPIHPEHHGRDSREQKTTPDGIQQRPGKY